MSVLQLVLLSLAIQRCACGWWPLSAISRPPNAAQQQELILVKMGGSAITDKSKFETFKRDSFDSISRDLAAAQRDCRHRFILVHGAGSFGHHTARAYNLSTGGDDLSWVEGFSKTHRSVSKLNSLVLEELHARGLSRVIHWPLFGSVKTFGKNAVLKRGFLGIRKLEEVLNAGFTPLMHGSMVLDSRQKCSVLSGDGILTAVAKAFNRRFSQRDYVVKSCVFLTDVDGVFDVNPSEHKQAKLIRKIRAGGRKNLGHVDGMTTGVVVPDVTGGIKAKVAAALEIANKAGVPVYIVRAGSASARECLLGRRPSRGTVILPYLHSDWGPVPMCEWIFPWTRR